MNDGLALVIDSLVHPNESVVCAIDSGKFFPEFGVWSNDFGNWRSVIMRAWLMG